MSVLLATLQDHTKQFASNPELKNSILTPASQFLKIELPSYKYLHHLHYIKNPCCIVVCERKLEQLTSNHPPHESHESRMSDMSATRE